MHASLLLPPLFPAETPVAELATAEAFVVASLRLWAAPHREPWHSHPDWRRGFAAAGLAADGAHAFDTLFWIVVAGGHRTLDVRCPRCPRLGEDEGRLLQLTACAQANLDDLALVTLEAWLPTAAARAALVHARIYAHAAARAGLVVPLPEPGAGQRVAHGLAAHAGAGRPH